MSVETTESQESLFPPATFEEAYPEAAAEEAAELAGDEVPTEPVADTPETTEVPEGSETPESTEPTIESRLDEVTRSRDGILAELRAMRQQMSALSTPPAEETPEETDPEPDAATQPAEYLAWQMRQVNGNVEQMRQEAIAKREAESMAAEQAAITHHVRSQIADYQAKNNMTQEVYESALQAAQEGRRAYYKTMGMNDERISGLLSMEAQSLIGLALQTRQNPAEMVVNLARQAGWQPPTANGKPGPSAAQVAAAAARAPRPSVTGDSAPPEADGAGWVTVEQFRGMTTHDPRWNKIVDNPNLFKDINDPSIGRVYIG